MSRAGEVRASLASEHWSELRPILARHWHGGGVAKSAGTESGELALDLSVDIVPDDNLQFSGQLRMTSRWDTGTYSATYAISGSCWSTDGETGIAIERTSLSSADDLPSNLFWQGLTGKLRLFSNRDYDGHWLLDGTLYGTQDSNAFETQLSER